MQNRVRIMSCGLGTNSVGLLVGMSERGEKPDVILFADTGGENPRTYAYLPTLNAWLEGKGFPLVHVVQYQSQYVSLEAECLAKETVPSLAFGHKRCSQKLKQRPMHNWVRQYVPAMEVWKRDERVVKLLGIGADEQGRARIEEDRWYEYEYPLISWGWGRRECQEAIARAGLPDPRKSACFFCPAMKKHEILALAAEEPELAKRAVAMERAAKDAGNLEKIKGLGRHWSWEAFLTADAEQQKLFTDRLDDVSCVCANTPIEAIMGDDESQAKAWP